MRTYLAVLFSVSVLVAPGWAERFNRNNDLLLAQFDSRPDPDDIQAQAAMGCILAHDDYQDVNYYAVQGAVGVQGGVFLNSDELFDMAFGSGNWTDAWDDWDGSVTRIKNKVKPILQNGGHVWVAEGGQSDITSDWLNALIADGVSASLVKSNVHVVQHSNWNYDMTDDDKAANMEAKSDYIKIADGNYDNWTPNYKTYDTGYLPQALNSPNLHARALWTESKRVTDQISEDGPVSNGGVDYSDTVEVWYILEIQNGFTIAEFWDRFVINDHGGDPDPEGVLFRDYWTGVPGTSVADIPVGTTPTGADTVPRLEGTSWNNPSVTSAIGDEYGQVIYGYLTPSTSGLYTFWIASDDSSEFYMSLDADPANAAMVASVDGYTAQYQWDKYTSQKSTPLSLNAGQSYYIEVRHKEHRGGDHVAVGWAKPGESTTDPSELVPAQYLSMEPVGANESDVGVQIEAEDFDTQNGVQVVGGWKVGYVNEGDWICFHSMNLDGAASFSAAVASGTSGGTIEIRSGAVDGALLGSVSVGNTGDWNTMQVVSTPVSAVSGINDIYLVFTGGSGFLLDVDYLQFDEGSNQGDAELGVKIEAELFDAQSGVQTVGDWKVGYIEDGDWIRFDDLAVVGATSFTAQLTSGTSGGTVEIRSGSVGGALLGSVSVGNTGGWNTVLEVSGSVSGFDAVADVYLVFVGGSGFLLDIDSFQFD